LKDGLEAIRACDLNTAPARIRWARVPAADWAESWKRHFPPLQIAGRLLVRPSWSRVRPKRGQVEVVLDPGLSFGTGQHPTTAFCLEEVARWSASVENREAGMLDVGTGSGVLAIAAARLGCGPVSAFDYDAEAVAVARENAERNGVRDQIRFSRRDVADLPVEPRRRWGLVCANLTSDLLLRHAGTLWNHVRPGGRLVLAGILKEEFGAVQERFVGLGARLSRSRIGKEWRSGSFSRAAES
jgi:ribosomal protein L11 methyltransferase